ncbi:hypothetical protein BJV74DRAFT_840903, partial [Russula compacta]
MPHTTSAASSSQPSHPRPAMPSTSVRPSGSDDDKQATHSPLGQIFHSKTTCSYGNVPQKSTLSVIWTARASRDVTPRRLFHRLPRSSCPEPDLLTGGALNFIYPLQWKLIMDTAGARSRRGSINAPSLPPQVHDPTFSQISTFSHPAYYTATPFGVVVPDDDIKTRSISPIESSIPRTFAALVPWWCIGNIVTVAVTIGG